MVSYKTKYVCAFTFVGVLILIFGIYVFYFIEADFDVGWSRLELQNYFSNQIVCRNNWIDIYGLEQNILGK